jgi:uncharacterized glyoxalase superfamily protein PhnB
LIMLATPTPLYESPRRHADHCDSARAWSSVPWIINGVLVYVDKVEAHFARAKSAGAMLLSEIETGFPGPRYRAAARRDSDGCSWSDRRHPERKSLEGSDSD